MEAQEQPSEVVENERQEQDRQTEIPDQPGLHMPSKLLEFSKQTIRRKEVAFESRDELTVSQAFENFKATILKVDLDDAVKRLARTFPLDERKCALLRTRVQQCRTTPEVIALNDEFMANLGQYLQDEYREEELDGIRRYINKIRDQVDLQGFCATIGRYIHKAIAAKRGWNSWRYQFENPKKLNFQSMMDAAEEDLARSPIIGGRSNSVYTQFLAERYDNDEQAREHILAVTINAAAQMVETTGFYYFKHKLGEQDRDLQYAAMQFAQRAEIFADEEWKDDLNGLIAEIESFTKNLEGQARKLFNSYSLTIKREQTVDQILAVHDEKVQAVVQELGAFRQPFQLLIGKAFALLHRIDIDDENFQEEMGCTWFDNFISNLEEKFQYACCHFSENAIAHFICDRSAGESTGTGEQYARKFDRVYVHLELLNYLKYIRILLGGHKPICSIDRNLSFSPERHHIHPLSYEEPVFAGIKKEMDQSFKERFFGRLMMEGDIDLYGKCQDPPHVMAPPSASGDRALRLEAVRGCNHSACTFCEMSTRHGSEKFSHVDAAWFKRHVALVSEYVCDSMTRMRINKVFLGNGNAFAMDAATFTERVKIALDHKFRKIECYGRSRDICKYTDEELADLAAVGLSLVYIGLESGSDDVLKLVNKGQTREEFIMAVQKLQKAKIDVSVMVMPGLGGTKHAEAHGEKTAQILAEVLAKFAVFLPLDCPPDRRYAQDIESDPENSPLNPEETRAQVKLMRDRFVELAKQNPELPNRGKIQIAAHKSDVTPVAAEQPEVFELKLNVG